MGLSRERIIETALELVEQHGWSGLSMRRLAQKLDVWPMAVYRYFRDKDELLDAIGEEAAAQVTLPSGGGPWRTQIRELLRDSRAALAGQAASGTLRGPAGRRLSDAGVGILEASGLDASVAGKAWRALFAYAVAFPAGQDGDFEFGLECLLDGLEARQGDDALVRDGRASTRTT